MINTIKTIIRENSLSSKLIEWKLENSNIKKTIQIANDLKNKGCKFSSINEIKKLKPNNIDTCHIIGAGWSLLDSINKINPKTSYIIGFNNSAFANIPFDLYFTEHAGETCKDIMNLQLALFEETIFQSNTPLFFKNIWDCKNDVTNMTRHFKNKATFIKDYPLFCLNKNNVFNMCNRLMKNENVFLKQYASTVVMLISIAYKMGFSKIIIHGVDFSGSYFFELKNFKSIRSTPTPEKLYKKLYPQSTMKKDAGGKFIHNTSIGVVGMPEVLPILKTYLVARGVHLLAGTSKSPSSSILNFIQ